MTYEELLEWAKARDWTEDQMLRKFLIMERPWETNDEGDLVDMFMEGIPPYKMGFKEWWEDLGPEDQEQFLEALPR